MAIEVGQSIPICLVLSSVGGIIEVFATAILAYQDAQERQAGERWSTFKARVALAANVTLQVLSSVVGNLFAPWFGPVSIVGPTFLVAQLVANMAVFGSFLGLESFTKDMNVGTYVVVTAAVMLPVVGPAAQDGQDIVDLLITWWAQTWGAFNVFCMSASCVLLVTLDIQKLRESRRIALLLAARASAFTVNLTVSRIFILGPTTPVLIVALVLKISSGAIITHALVVQATAVEQAVFVPLNASALIIVNACSGLIIWEDWKVVASWVGYVCVFVQLVLGNYLLLGDLETLRSDNSKYGAAKSVKMVLKPERRYSPCIALAEDGAMGLGEGKTNFMEGGAIAGPSCTEVRTNHLSVVAEESKSPDKRYVEFIDHQVKEETLKSPSSLSREPRGRSTRKQAWSVVYGLDNTEGRGKIRQRSIFARDDNAASELASLRQIL
uniref:Uncharacterized protein n=1 Tax=Odontella aurita TaxID=265563 RepID=A0A7S4K4L9_9STRA|mmetsp:Transcript_61458/g.181634  ORF Transcript_61458/g.181634 Transcript_61458/m.181634 type:complete len:439 (+) Transcript_61458:147-1463(+)